MQVGLLSGSARGHERPIRRRRDHANARYSGLAHCSTIPLGMRLPNCLPILPLIVPFSAPVRSLSA